MGNKPNKSSGEWTDRLDKGEVRAKPAAILTTKVFNFTTVHFNQIDGLAKMYNNLAHNSPGDTIDKGVLLLYLKRHPCVGRLLMLTP